MQNTFTCEELDTLYDLVYDAILVCDTEEEGESLQNLLDKLSQFNNTVRIGT